jgi:hypothetical protein
MPRLTSIDPRLHLDDVGSMLRDELVERERLRELVDEIEPALFRYPAIDARSFRTKVERALR